MFSKSSTKIYVLSNNKYGLINYNGDELVPCEYDWLEIDEERDDIVYTCQNNLYGILDADERQVIAPCIYKKKIHFSSWCDFAIVNEDNNKFIINKKGKILPLNAFSEDGKPVVICSTGSSITETDFIDKPIYFEYKGHEIYIDNDLQLYVNEPAKDESLNYGYLVINDDKTTKLFEDQEEELKLYLQRK